MAIIGIQKGSGKRLRVREKSVKSQGILIRIMSGNPAISKIYLRKATDLLTISDSRNILKLGKKCISDYRKNNL